MASTPSGTIFALADRILNGELVDRLTDWRTQDPRVSFDEIADRLKAEGVKASRETVRRWCDTLDLTDPEPERAA